MPQPDEAREVLPLDMNWQNTTDFSPHILPADAVEDVPDEAADANFRGENEEELTGGDVDPKDSPASGPVTEPESVTYPDPDDF